MAILGTLIDKTTASLAGGAAVTQVTTKAHSLPATNPEIQVPVLKSIAAGSGNGVDVVTLLALGGNASLQTIGFATTQSTASFPTVYYDLYALVCHSRIR